MRLWGVGGGGGGEGVFVNLGVILVRVCQPVFRFIYLAFEKTPIQPLFASYPFKGIKTTLGIMQSVYACGGGE